MVEDQPALENETVLIYQSENGLVETKVVSDEKGQST